MGHQTTGRLTASQEDYLKAIYELLQRDGSAHVTDLAARLGVSKASASTAVRNLREKGLACRDAGRRVLLTPEGERQARRVMGNFSLISDFLTSELKVSPETASHDAHAMEHLLSEGTAAAMRRLLAEGNG